MSYQDSIPLEVVKNLQHVQHVAAVKMSSFAIDWYLRRKRARKDQHVATVKMSSLESFTNVMEDASAANLVKENTPTNNETSSKDKKRKSRLSNASNDDHDALVIKEGFDCVAKTIVISSQTLLKACPQMKMPAKEIWHLVDRLGLEGKTRRNAYVLLVMNSDMLDAVSSAPPEEQKEILLDLLG